MSKTYEELLHDAFCKCMQENHGKDWVDRYDPEEQENMRREFCSGAEWQATNSPWISVEMAIPKDDSPGVVQVRTVDGKEGEMAARRVMYNIYPYIKTGYVTHWRVFNE
nr:MAG TPA: hypothetical protein [Caudoviricetes sp.]